ncbi:MAG TPA: pyridoxal 5'-phosphate synthase [Steroidobacteraceae bacterium]|jgi:pyridoxamine 5'-phosphate oxidase
MDLHTELLPDPLPPDPLVLLARWLEEALKARHQPNPNALVLATVSPDGKPSARVVLLKDLVPHPGYIVFYTNYHSRKGRELADHPRAAAVIHWDHLHRQVRVEGAVVQSPAEESDAYFASRPWQSRVGAWASQQSEPVDSRQKLSAAVEEVTRRFGITDPWLGAGPRQGSSGPPVQRVVGDPQVPRPPHWGGYRLWVDTIELWVEGAGRIHDRARWSRTLERRSDDSFEVGHWNATRLQP